MLLQDRRKEIAAMLSHVEDSAKKFSAEVGDSQGHLDSVVGVVMSAMPADVDETRIFFPVESEENKIPGTPWSKEYPHALAWLVGLSCFCGLAALVTGWTWPLIFLAGMMLLSLVMTIGEAWANRSRTITRTRPGTAIRFKRYGKEIKLEIWLGTPARSEREVASLASNKLSYTGKAWKDGWRETSLAKVRNRRGLSDDEIVTKFEEVSDRWQRKANGELGLATRLLQSQARQVGLQ